MKKLAVVLLALWMCGGVLKAYDARFPGQEIDRLLAAVNGKVITEWDIRTARTLTAVLELGKSQEPQSRKEELDRLIDQELIRQEMENFPIGAKEREGIENKVQEQVLSLKNAYAEIGGLPALLRQLGLREEELASHLRLIALTTQFMNIRFRPFLSAEPSEGLEEKLKSAMDQWIENIRNHSRIEIFANAELASEVERP
jgi:hypothetical protein